MWLRNITNTQNIAIFRNILPLKAAIFHLKKIHLSQDIERSPGFSSTATTKTYIRFYNFVIVTV